MRLYRYVAMLPIMGALGHCTSGSRADAPATSALELCSARRAVRVDRAYAIGQARRALEGFLPSTSALELSSLDSLRQGMLISLVPAHPQGTGGGGLVWVDGDNGCPIILRRYE